MKAPFPYYGGKQRLASWLVSLLPAHRVYLEPFFGSGAVLFAKPPAAVEVVNDRDGGVVGFFRVLRDRPEELERVCRLTPYSRLEHEAADVGEPVGELELARRFWVRVNQSFAHSSTSRTGWSVTTARTQSASQSAMSRIARFEECAQRLAGVAVEHCDGAELVDRLATPETVVYADPPYLGTTRAGGGISAPGGYRHDMGDDASHERLAEVLKATEATVVISGYPSDLYDRLYAGWWSASVATKVQSAGPGRPRTGRTEVVWSNRDLTRCGRLFDLDAPGVQGVSWR